MLCYPNKVELKEKFNKYVYKQIHIIIREIWQYLLKHITEANVFFLSCFYRLKSREWFRPLCPSIAVECIPKLFKGRLTTHTSPDKGINSIFSLDTCFIFCPWCGGQVV